jgi:hypothetical protein
MDSHKNTIKLESADCVPLSPLATSSTSLPLLQKVNTITNHVRAHLQFSANGGLLDRSLTANTVGDDLSSKKAILQAALEAKRNVSIKHLAPFLTKICTLGPNAKVLPVD